MALKRQNRLSAKDFKELQNQKGFWVKSAILSVKSVKNNLAQSRFGFVVSLKVSRRATERNLIKRRLRAIIAKNIKDIKNGFDVIVITTHALKDKSYKELEKDFLAALKKIKLI